MGIVWETYHKEVPLLGVPENPTDEKAKPEGLKSYFCHEILTPAPISGGSFWMTINSYLNHGGS